MSTGILSRATDAFWGLVDPWLFMSLSASFLPRTVVSLFRTHSFVGALRVLLTPSRFREAWFGHFWGYAGPGVRENSELKVLPLLDGRVSDGRVVEAPTGPGVGGVVIEIGPGSGMWVEIFADRHLHEGDDDNTVKGEGANEEDSSALRERKQQQRRPSVTNNSEAAAKRRTKKKRANTARTEITRVYGVEPNTSHHGALRRAVEAAGLEDVYEIVPVGIEDLSCSSSSTSGNRNKWEGSIEPGTVDCIVSVLCLCSIPEPERHIRELYELLRPGGRWYVYEHVQCEYSWYMRLYQRIINLIWPYFIGGCELCRQTEKTLTEAGHWTSINLGQPPAEPWYHPLPHILGVFTK
ncbi:S-adenosyl-L-methionine-dependent methyltransferase [Xylariaceae sp. FL1651]|nr:S-adenosyl-L-methionine-dependent methyltransferase [Xylariaceae sp. FL1651]